MVLTKRPGYRATLLLAGLLAVTGILGAADGTNADDIATLKAQIAEQQKQLEALQLAIANQQKLLEKAAAAAVAPTPLAPSQLVRPANLGAVTSLTPMVPTAPVNPTLPVVAAQAGKAGNGNPCETGYEGNAVPPYLRLGNICIQPVGFMDMTAVWRDRNAGSGIGTNFGSIPYNNSFPAAKNSEFHFSPQNSRIGFRIDGNWKDVHFIGYNEFDFLSSATPGSADVSNGAFVPRLRLFWVDARKGKVEFLAGQSWSFLVPNRSGLSALPGDLFYSQAIDVNYMAGLTWTRQPGLRVIYHPNDKVALGVAFENPTQYIGGSAGGSGITLPAALGALAGPQLDNTSANFLASATVMPDIIGKVAFDPNSKVHLELAGLVSTFKVWNPVTNTYSTTAGGGGSINGNFEIAKGFRLITNNFYGAGGGRYLFGQAPDVVVGADGTLKTVNSGGFVEGFELNHKNWLYYVYYGDIYIDRQALLDANGKTPIGYGFTGSPNTQNRNLSEISFGFNQTIWKDARYGAINLMSQYEYMLRRPWYVAAGAPKAAHDNTIYVNIRYTLPGSMPKF
jgi:hypothetical protein